MRTLRRRPAGPSRAPVVPGYDLLAPLAFGATGAVWSGRDAAGRPVAVSVLPLPAGPRGAAQLRRLGRLREGRHPHLARVLDVVGLDADRCAVVAEVVTGPTLATVRAARGPLPVAEAAGLLAALGAGLGHLHERGLIHGDVSPTNVVLAPGGVPVLVDLAGEGVVERGTAGFVAPERTGGAPPSAPGDVWALARLVLWVAGDDDAVAAAVAPALAAEPARRPGARDLAARAPSLARAASVRLPDDADLAQAQLRAGAHQVPTQLTAPRRPRRRHAAGRRGRVMVAALAALAAVAGGVWWTGARTDAGAVDASRGPDETQLRQVVAGLLERRDRALAAGDRAALAALTVAGSPAAQQDAALLARLRAAGVRVEGLGTALVALEERGRAGAGAGRVRVDVQVVTRQGGYALVPDGSVPVTGGGGSEVPAQAPRCAVLTVLGPPWRVEEVGRC
ncbi:protein kinase domain-containing protein [Georgenia ruanii]|nr:protein kinase [Georgenia ruanii]MPV88362.1 protein kinase [Georgenia ruanii]